MKMENAVFELVHKDADKVVIKVKKLSNFEIAMHPYLDSSYEYITVTRGKQHILIVTRKEGNAFSFHWGAEGYTLISENLKALKKAVVDFIETDCHILLDWDDGDVSEVHIFYNRIFKSWQLSLEGLRNGERISAYYRATDAQSEHDMMKIAENYINVSSWDKGVARTGISIWKAVF